MDVLLLIPSLGIPSLLFAVGFKEELTEFKNSYSDR